MIGMKTNGKYTVRVFENPPTISSPIDMVGRTISRVCTRDEAAKLVELLDNGAFRAVTIDPVFEPDEVDSDRPIRETTMRHDEDTDLVRVFMPTDDQVLMFRGPAGNLREVSRGKFETQRQAADYYCAKVNSLRRAGWRILSFA